MMGVWLGAKPSEEVVVGDDIEVAAAVAKGAKIGGCEAVGNRA
jgi:hypothetical protein